jgi:hypothetical protein
MEYILIKVQIYLLSDKHTVEYMLRSSIESPYKTKSTLYSVSDKELSCEQKGNLGDFLDRRGGNKSMAMALKRAEDDQLARYFHADYH